MERVLEIGTGGGAIAIACAIAFPNATIDAVDVCDDALALARENCAAHGVEDRGTALAIGRLCRGARALRPDRQQSSLCRCRDDGLARYRSTATNPGSGLRRALTASTACVGSWTGADGHLRVGGVLVCEVGASRPALERACPEAGFTWLELERGGEGVFLLTGVQLAELKLPGGG